MKRNKLKENNPCTDTDSPTAKKDRAFSGLIFRQKLTGENPIAALQWFLKIFRKHPMEQDIVLEYFEAGGNGEEILLLLGDESRSIEEISLVFNVLECICMRIMTDLPSYLPDAEVTAKCLLQSHMSTVYRLLAANSPFGVKKSTLKLLTVMSTLSAKVAKYILNYWKINFNMLCQLARHQSLNSTRPYFIHLVLSFLVEDDPSVIKLLLDNKGFLKSIFIGLMYDTGDTVELVLATVQKYILENLSISKTTKLHIFNSSILKLFFDLFNWKGPQKQIKKYKPLETAVAAVDSVAKGHVEEALFGFLRVLCASKKYGVVFFDPTLGVSGRNHNELVQKVLEKLEKPWEHKFIGKLLLEIFISSPDLIHLTTSRTIQSLTPRLSAKWFRALNFINEVISNVDPSMYLSKPGSLTQAQLLLVVERIVAPKSLLQIIAGSTASESNPVDEFALTHSHILVRHSAVCLLNSVIEASTKFLHYKGLEEYLGSSLAVNQFYQNLLEHLSKVLPNVGSVLKVWKQALHDVNHDETNNEELKSMLSSCDLSYPSATDHLKAILTLLLSYARWWPPLEISAERDSDGDGWNLLSSMNILMESQKFVGLEAMALELLSATGGFSLSTDQGLCNQDALKRLLHLYGKEKEKSTLQSWRKLLLSVLLKTGLFDANETEACIWIHCYRYWCHNENQAGDETFDALTDYIVSSVCELINSTEHYLCIIANAFEATSNLEDIPEEEQNLRNLTRHLLTDTMKKDTDNEENGFIINDERSCLQNMASISPLLPAALNEVKNHAVGSLNHDAINRYLLYVVLHILHGQNTSKSLLYILKNNGSSYSPPKSLKRYLKSWSTSKPQSASQLLSCDNNLGLVSNMLLQNKMPDNVCPIINGIRDSLDILLLFRLVIFHLAQLAQQDCINEFTLATGKELLRNLIQHSYLSENEENFLYQTEEGKNINISGLCLKSALSNSVILKFFEPIGSTNDSQKYMTELVDFILSFAHSLPDDKDFINELSSAFTNRFLMIICISLRNTSKHSNKEVMKIWDKKLVETFLSHFMLSSDNVMFLLRVFESIPSEILIDSSNWLLSGPGMLLKQLLEQHCKLKKVGFRVITKADVFHIVVNHLSCLEEKFELDARNKAGDGLSDLEDSILQLLQIFPHLIEFFPQRLLQILISSKCSRKSANSLVQLLLKENENSRCFLMEECLTHWNKVFLHPDRLLLYITCILNGGKSAIPDNILLRIYEEYKSRIKEIFSEGHSTPLWLENNVQLFKLIVQRVVDEDFCFKLVTLFKKKSGIVTEIQPAFLEISQAVFEKAEKSSCVKSGEWPRISLLRLVLYDYVNVLKKVTKIQSSHSDNLDADVEFHTTLICSILDGVNKQKTDLKESDEIISCEWNEIQKDQIWKEFTQLALKIGLSQNNSSVLKCLGQLILKVLRKGDSETALLYKLCIMHSKFLDVMLEDNIGKVEILEILLILAEKNPVSLSSSLIPVLLSSYNATLRSCDILILKLLQILESDVLNFNQFSPYLWGEMAANFYSLKTKMKSAAFSAFSVLRQPKADQVLSLIDLDVVDRTLSNFPTHRSLLAEMPINNNTDVNVYDPCFYLPLLSHILAPENPVKVYKVAQSGALALTVAALGSSANQIRAAAMHVLARFYNHLETGKLNKEKKLWLNFINVIRNGYGLLAKSKDVDVSCLQLPPVVAVFLAKACLVMTLPMHKMFYPLHNFFLAKPALDLDVVPEFFRLFNSVEIESLCYRHWILEVLRDGFKDSSDFRTCLKSGTFKLLQCCFSSVVCDTKSKVLILEVLTSAVKIPSTAYYLVKRYGLLSWLLEVVRQLPLCLNKEDPLLAKSVIHLLSSLQLSFYKEDNVGLYIEKESDHASFSINVSNSMVLLYLYLLPKILYVDLHVKDFYEYIKSLCCITKTFYEKQPRKVKLINVLDVKNVILLGKNVLKQVDVCQDALEYGCYIFPPNKELFSNFDETSIEALQYLFKFVVTWCQNER